MPASVCRGRAAACRHVSACRGEAALRLIDPRKLYSILRPGSINRLIVNNPSFAYIGHHIGGVESRLRNQVFSFLCTFVPGSEKSTERTFAPVELSFRGTFAHWNFRSSGGKVPRTFVHMKLSFHENEYSKNFRSKCPKIRPETGYKPYNSLRALVTGDRHLADKPTR